MSTRILVVEDEDSLRDLYVKIMQDQGFEVVGVADGAEGYNKLHEGGYDLVLLDLVLPKMDGLAILEKIKENPPLNPNRFVVVLSNLGRDDAIGKAIALGVSGYMIKSDYTPDLLVEQVKRFLGM